MKSMLPKLSMNLFPRWNDYMLMAPTGGRRLNVRATLKASHNFASHASCLPHLRFCSCFYKTINLWPSTDI